MGSPSAHNTHLILPVLLASLTFILRPPSGDAQRPGGAQGPRDGQINGMPMERPLTLLVSVRESTGMPLQNGALVRLSSVAGSLHLTSATQESGTATFPDVKAGDYEIEVSAPQYKTAIEHASITGSGTNYTVYVYMQPESDVTIATGVRTGPIMTPRLQSEVDKGLTKMRHSEYDAARAHFEKAAKMAPANPDIQYLLGMLEYKQQHVEAARAKFEAALSIFPTHERSLVALGELQVRSGQSELAAQTLEKAYQVNGADWRVHLLLAHAYTAAKEYQKAERHAIRAVEFGKEHAAPARLLLGQILAAQSKDEQARKALESVIQYFPSDPVADEAKTELKKLNNLAVLGAERTANIPEPSTVSPQLPPLPVLARTWAPADIDAKEYVVAPDVSCQQEELIHEAQRRAMSQLANFEKFAATEHIEHQEVDANGIPGGIKAHDFNYLVFVQRVKNGSFFLEEDRDGGENLEAFPTSLASKGLVSIGVALFDPTYEGDLTYKCEGLGKYRGQAAWQIRFEQRQNVQSRLRTWRNKHGMFFLPLKGRVWVEANTYDVLHLETDLREPQKELELNRDHLIIDYGPVQFQGGKISLWLPWYAEMFMELHGKRYRHRHTLTNYALFSVDTTNTISPPKKKAATNGEPQAETAGAKP